MSPRGATHLAWSLWFLAIAFSGAYLFLVYVNRSGVGGWLANAVPNALGWAFSVCSKCSKNATPALGSKPAFCAKITPK